MTGRRETRINKEIDLPDADAEQPRNHQPRHIFDPGMRKRNPEFEFHSLPHQQRHLHKKLQDPAHKDSHDDGRRRILEVTPNNRECKHDRCQIQKDWSCGGQSKNVKAVQNAHRERRQRDEEQIRKYDSVQLNRLGAGNVVSREEVHHRG